MNQQRRHREAGEEWMLCGSRGCEHADPARSGTSLSEEQGVVRSREDIECRGSGGVRIGDEPKQSAIGLDKRRGGRQIACVAGARKGKGEGKIGGESAASFAG